MGDDSEESLCEIIEAVGEGGADCHLEGRRIDKSDFRHGERGEENDDIGDCCHIAEEEQLVGEHRDITVELVALMSKNRTEASLLEAQYEFINDLLLRRGEKSRVCVESEALDADARVRSMSRSFSNNWLSRLQRLYARVVRDPDHVMHVHEGFEEKNEQRRNNSNDENDEEDDLLIEDLIAEGVHSHLICHSSEGFFIPVDFHGAPLFDMDGNLVGGWCGSSYRLMDELMTLSPYLDMNLRPVQGGRVRRGGGYDLSSEALAALNDEVHAHTTSKFHAERMVWFALYEAARLSIKHSTSICFTRDSRFVVS